MWQLTIISGKGGTGKTILTASLASLARDKVVADCDVDAPDLHLLLSPQVRESHPFTGLKLARIDPSRCDRGKRCGPVCRFDAIRFPNDGDFFIDRSACEGCGVCERTCHTGAIVMEERVSGEWYVSRTSYGPMVHAQLDPGEETSGRLVAEVRGQAKKIAEQEGLGLVLIDGPPGTGCPVISAMTGAEEVVVVAEPTRVRLGCFHGIRVGRPGNHRPAGARHGRRFYGRVVLGGAADDTARHDGRVHPACDRWMILRLVILSES